MALIRKKSESFASNWIILVLDLVISTVASLFAVLLMRWVSAPIYGFQYYILIWLLLSLVASAASFFILKTYRLVIRYTTFLSTGKLAIASLLKEVILSVFVFSGLLPDSSIQLRAFALVLDLLLTAFLLVIVRVVIIQIMNSISTNMDENIGRLRVMVFGTSNKSMSMVTRLDMSSHYDIIGIIDTDMTNNGRVMMGKKVYSFSDKASLETLCMEQGIEGVLFTGSSDANHDVLDACMELGITILNMPRIESTVVHEVTQDAVKDLGKKDMFIYDGMTSVARSTKRIIDCVIAALCLIVFSPLFLIVYIAIKCEDHGPAIFKQERVGRFGRPFNIYKFRSMRVDAEAAGPALYAGEEDPRLTKVGRFIRAHHLDELPQLWNVFRGDMAFIGPRPERQFYIDQIMEADPRYYYLYQIRPGVTSYATLFNGYTDTLEKMLKRLEYDLYYLRHRSLWFDMRVLFLTFMNIVFGKKF